MAPTSRELVMRSLRFERPPRIPRDLWTLPWASLYHAERLDDIIRRFPPDIVSAPDVYSPSPRRRGDPYVAGVYTDEWGCEFANIQAGVHGEVRAPLLPSLDDWHSVAPPYETLPSNQAAARDTVNRFCDRSDLFVLSGCCPRPWERYQFLRGSQNALLDLGAHDERTPQLLRRIQDFYLAEWEFWARTDIDALRFMDDWGAQRRLLIAPQMWRELFLPLYREYCEIARAYGKFVFMHSDGHILAIYDDLIAIGVDAINSQLFCMDLAEVAQRAKGKITFWGEIDRQHVLPASDPAVGRAAVADVACHLYDPAGGIIAQLEFGAGANPDTVVAVYEAWEALSLQ